MGFLQPWWLLLLPVWPFLVLAARAREQRTPRPAADFLLWQRAAAKLPRPSSRARMSFRDLVWIAPLVLLTIGLAGPERRAGPAAAEVLVLVDRSASMATLGPDGTSRRERGIAAAQKLLGSRPHRLEGFPPGPPAEASALAAGGRDLVESAVTASAAGTPVLVVTDLLLADLPVGVGLVQVSDPALNAGITAAGLDPEAGLLVRVEADPGAGPRTLVVAGERGPIGTRPLEDPTSVRIVFPPATTSDAGATVTVRLEPRDALPLDDVVALVATRPPLRVALAAATQPSIARALRACPGVVVVDGADPKADLVVGAPPASAGASALFVAPAAAPGFELGPPVAVEGILTGAGPFDGLTGPARWPAVAPLLKEPPGTMRILTIGATPLLVRHENTFVLLGAPDANGWASLPSFPLTIARIVETVPVAAGGLAPRDGVLSSEETHVARGEPLPSRAPPMLEAPLASTALAPWCYAAALLAMLGLIVPKLRSAGFITSRRRGATPRTPPASAPVAASHRTERS